MRRILVAGSATIVLGASAASHATTSALNSYRARLSVSPNAAGSAKAPVPIALTENFKATGNNGNRTAPLTDIKAVLYGVAFNGKSFPTCTPRRIASANSDAGCPKGALVGTGAVTAVLAAEADTGSRSTSTVPCDPLLHVWNGGAGKLVFFFAERAPNHLCANGAITTGAIGPFTATVRTVGKKLVMNSRIPSYVSFPLAGVEASVTTESLHFLKVTKTVGGRRLAEIAAAGCQAGKRPYSITFTAEPAAGAVPQSDTVKGDDPCT